MLMKALYRTGNCQFFIELIFHSFGNDCQKLGSNKVVRKFQYMSFLVSMYPVMINEAFVSSHGKFVLIFIISQFLAQIEEESSYI